MGWPVRQTCESLGLNLEAGYAGNLDEVLPEAQRNFQGASELALPTNRYELAKLCKMEIPPEATGPGVIYLKRAADRWLKLSTKVANRRPVGQKHRGGLLKVASNNAREAIHKALDEVRVSADLAHQEIASIAHLFALGRRAIGGQLQAHLDGTDWKGEKINARAARECFRLVSQSVNSLNLPSDQRRSATEATMKEMASAIEATKDALAPIPPPADEPEQTH